MFVEYKRKKEVGLNVLVFGEDRIGDSWGNMGV